MNSHGHPVTDSLLNLLEVYHANLGLGLKDAVDKLAPRAQADVPFFDVADSFRVFKSRASDSSDIA